MRHYHVRTFFFVVLAHLCLDPGGTGSSQVHAGRCPEIWTMRTLRNVCVCADELCELKEEKQTLTAREEKKEVKDECSEEDEQGGVKDEEEELEELRSQVVQLLLELEELREVSQRHEENFMELQGAELQNQRFFSLNERRLNLNMFVFRSPGGGASGQRSSGRELHQTHPEPARSS